MVCRTNLFPSFRASLFENSSIVLRSDEQFLQIRSLETQFQVEPLHRIGEDGLQDQPLPFLQSQSVRELQHRAQIGRTVPSDTLSRNPVSGRTPPQNRRGWFAGPTSSLPSEPVCSRTPASCSDRTNSSFRYALSKPSFR